MVRLLACVAFGFVLATLTPNAAFAQKKVEVIKTYKGSVENESAAKPVAIATEKTLAEVWKSWNLKDEMPKVDFKKNIVVGVYSSGSQLNLSGVQLDDKGNLEALGFGTRDLRPGFRFVLGVVSRDGVKTVSKKDLPID